MSLIQWKRDEFSPSFSSMLDDLWGRDIFKRIELGTSVPAANITDKEGAFFIDLAVPGSKKEDFKVSIEGNTLVISSEKKDEKEEKKDNQIIRREFSYSSFHRSFSLPEVVDKEKITASYENGLLKITLPKKETTNKTNAKTIEIQ